MRSKDEIEFQRRTFEIAFRNLKRRKNFLQDKVNFFD